MKEKFNIALKNQYKNKKIDVVAIVGDVIIFVADSEMIVASITTVTKENNKPIMTTGKNQDLVNHLNYIENGKQGYNLVENECDEYVLVDDVLYYFSHEKTIPVAKGNNISSNTTIGDDIPLCI